MSNAQIDPKIGLMIAESSSTLIWISDDKKECVYFNKAWLKFRGRTLEQEYGFGWAQGVHPDDYERCLEIFNQAFDEREAFSMNYRLKCADGSYRWIQDNGDPYFENGKFVGYIGSCYDITETINSKNQLLETNKIFEHLTNSINEVFWFSDLGIHSLIYVSPALKKLWGIEPEKLYQEPQLFISKIVPEDQENYINTVEKYHAKGVEYKCEYRINAASGKIVTISERGFPVYDESGEIAHMAGLCTDITDLKSALLKASQAKQESNTLGSLLDTAENVASIGYWEFFPETRQVMWSHGMFSIYNKKPEIFTPTLSSFTEYCSTTERQVLRKNLDELFINGGDWKQNVSLKITSSLIKHIVFSASARKNENGDVDSIIGIVQDVTSLTDITNEKELLSRAVGFTNTGMVITDKHQRVIWINKAFTELSGYSLPEIKDQTLGKYLQGPETDKNTVTLIREQIRKEENVSVEILNYAKSGKPYWNNLFITPVYTDNKVSHFIGFQNDITELKSQREQLARLKRVETINELASGIAHDINNILGIISGNSELIAMKLETPPLIADNLNAISRAVNRAKQTTSKLLRTSRQLQSSREKVDVAQMLTELNTLLCEVIPNNIELILHIDTNTSIYTSKTDLEDTLTNLIVNAKNAIEHHGVITITSTLKNGFIVDEDTFVYATPNNHHSYVTIKIADTGIGIDKGNFESIFSPFVSSRAEKGGTGLGLAMVAGFVARENLGLTIKSKVNYGTEIELWLPESQIINSIIEEHAVLTSPIKKDLSIVLIDDEPDILYSTSQYLKEIGYTAELFTNATEAAKYIEQNIASIDVIVTDEVMPGEVQGHDISNQFSHLIPVIIASGFSKNHRSSISKNHFIQKPYSFSQLVSCINQNLNASKAGFYKIWKHGNILFAQLSGEWDERIATSFANDFKETASSFQNEWAHLVHLDDWELCTNDMISVIQSLVDWCISNGLRRAAQVYSPSMVKKEFLDEMIVEEQGEFKRAVFSATANAISWLEAEGYEVNRTKVTF